MKQPSIGIILLLVLSTCALLAGCTRTAKTIGPFTQVSDVESGLQRGISTKMDVQRVLGKPNGSGGAVFPTDPRPREVWSYIDIEMAGVEGVRGITRVNVRQQFLTVFFYEGLFDGFMWYSAAGVAKTRW